MLRLRSNSRKAPRTHFCRPRFANVVLLAASLCFSLEAVAQSAADLSEASRNATRIQREQDERQRAELQQALENARRQGKIVVPPVPRVEVPPTPGCVQVREIRIDDAPHLTDATRRRIASVYAGHCLTLADIQQVLSDVVADYIVRGQIGARAYIRQQDASTGVLSILVVEGKLEKIILDDAGRASINIGTAFPGLVGKPVNLRDLEMGLEQVNRLASNRATLEMLPGLDPGGSVVSIRNDPTRRWRATASADNEGGESTGRKQASVGLGVDNPLGLNDFFNLTYRRAVPTDYARAGSVAKSLAYIVPYGYNTLTLGINDSSFVSTLHTAGGQDLRSNGDSRNRFVQADRVVYRDQTSRVNLSTTLTGKTANNYLAEQFLAASSRALAVWDIDAGWSQQWRGGVWSFQLGVSRGLDHFGALRDADGLPDSAPHAQFRKVRYGASFMQPLDIGDAQVSLSSSLTGQRGIDVLYGSEQFLVGGIYNVRGFVNTTLSGDDGFAIRNELAVRIPVEMPLAGRTLMRPYLGLDYGRIMRRGPDSQAGYLSGAALGVSVICGDINVDLFNAWPLGMSTGLKRESSRLYLQLRAVL